MIWMYLVAFLTGLLIDTIPIFAPPAWPILLFFVVRYDLNIWLVTVLGVLGTTFGRGILCTYIPWLSRKILNHREDQNLTYLGQRLNRSYWSAVSFVFLYSMTPLSTTALFTAAGMAKARLLVVLPPFFIAKLISYFVLISTGSYAVENFASLAESMASWKTIVSALAGLLLICAFLFIDWRLLLEEKKLRLNFRIWATAA